MNDRFRGQWDALAAANDVLRDWLDGTVKGTLAGHTRACIISAGAIKDGVTPEYIEGYNEFLDYLLNTSGFPKD